MVPLEYVVKKKKKRNINDAFLMIDFKFDSYSQKLMHFFPQ